MWLQVNLYDYNRIKQNGKIYYCKIAELHAYVCIDI